MNDSPEVLSRSLPVSASPRPRAVGPDRCFPSACSEPISWIKPTIWWYTAVITSKASFAEPSLRSTDLVRTLQTCLHCTPWHQIRSDHTYRMPHVSKAAAQMRPSHPTVPEMHNPRSTMSWLWTAPSMAGWVNEPWHMQGQSCTIELCRHELFSP